jgi:hypothetical protein
MIRPRHGPTMARPSSSPELGHLQCSKRPLLSSKLVWGFRLDVASVFECLLTRVRHTFKWLFPRLVPLAINQKNTIIERHCAAHG